MPKKIRPLFDRVLVEKIDADKTTPGGLIIPDTAEDRGAMFTARVIEVGMGGLRDLVNASDIITAGDNFKGLERHHAILGMVMPVSPGDVVVLGKYTGSDAGDNRLLVRVDEILGVIEDVS